jgi:ribosomal protein L11 methyltransferase
MSFVFDIKFTMYFNTNINWIEASMVVDGELAEAVADVFSRYVSGGVVIESTAISSNTDGEGEPTGPVRVCGYLPVDISLDDNRHELERALWYVGRISTLPPVQYKPIQSTNWVETWKEHYEPIPIGEQLIVVPAWLDPAPDDRIHIKIDPGMAFGTGTHPSTILCLGALEKRINQVGPPSCGIDIGCGSGILSIAAIKLGVEFVLGVDIDPMAIKYARENAAINQVTSLLELEVGSVRDILRGKYSISQAPLIFANILAPVIIGLFDEGLDELLFPGGCLILSGILEEQSSEILTIANAHGLKLNQHYQIDDWVAFCFENPEV